LANEPISAALMDLKMPRKDGMHVLKERQEQLEELPIIVVTALGGSGAAIEAMKLGAYDYITKPFDLDEVLFTLRRALKQRRLAAQFAALQAALDPADSNLAAEEIVGQSQAMLAVFKLVGRVANTDEAVFIAGESGSGKELIANAIHAHSPRDGRPFVKINCAALSPMLLESELFGHERGAFTGAVARRIGRFEQADGGTLFLDEIGDLDTGLQAKLLRVLQTGQFERVGGADTICSNVRIISATHQDMPAMIAARRFREDLFYRLNVVTIELPPLRSRREDIPLLAEHFLRRLAEKYSWPHLTVAPETMDAMLEQPWPGNVRQLQNALARAAMLSGGRLILREHLAPAESATNLAEPAAVLPAGATLPELLARVERAAIAQALRECDWNRTRAAERLGISRRQLFDKIRSLGLTPE
jgi:DNA-binding NtrC family response regulator